MTEVEVKKDQKYRWDLGLLIGSIIDMDKGSGLVKDKDAQSYLEASISHKATSIIFENEGQQLASDAYGKVADSYKAVYNSLK